jgi:hypothetical protein
MTVGVHIRRRGGLSAPRPMGPPESISSKKKGGR